MFEESYTFGRFLGEGSYGSVRVVLHKETQVEYAVKVIDKAKAGSVQCLMLENEIGVLKLLQHPNIIILHEVYETPKRTFLVFELATSTLNEYTAEVALSEREIASITAQITSAIAYMHEFGIAHRDLKLENIVIVRPPPPRGRPRTESTESTGSTGSLGGTLVGLASESSTPAPEVFVKICDFGLAAVKSKETQLQLACGTPAYMAPEVLADSGGYSPLCDLWSLGVVLYILISGNLPFQRKNEGESFLSVIQKTELQFSAEKWDSVDSTAKDLVRRLLHVDPARRITAKEILDHPWITGRRPPEGLGTQNNTTVLDMMKAFAATQNNGSPTMETSPMFSDMATPALDVKRHSVSKNSLSGTPDVALLRKQGCLVAGTAVPTTKTILPGYMRGTQASRKGVASEEKQETPSTLGTITARVNGKIG